MSDRDEFGAFLVGFIVGGLSGAVVALLFAPQSGEETRAIIKDKSIELRDKAQMNAEEAIARAEAVAADARARADELTKQLRDRGQEVVEDVRERSKSAMEAVRKTTKISWVSRANSSQAAMRRRSAGIASSPRENRRTTT